MNKEKITKKDLYYIIAILIGINVAIITLRLGDNQNVINYFGFAGTLISIILAVVAIIYSFYQSSTYENTTLKLDNSAKKIEETTLKLESVNDIKEVTNELQGTYNQLNKKVQEVQEVIKTVEMGINEFATTVKDNLETFSKTVEVKFNNIHESVEFTKRDILKELSFKHSNKSNELDALNESRKLDGEEEILQLVNKLSSHHLVFIYYYYCLQKYKLANDIDKIIDWAIENDISSWSEAWKETKDEKYYIATTGYVLCITGIMESNGLIEFDNNYNVSNMNQHLCEYLMGKELEENFVKLDNWVRESHSKI